MHIDAFRPGGDRAHKGQVTAKAAHHFDNEAPVQGHGGLLDFVDHLYNAIQRRVRANAQLRARQVVVNAGRDTDQGNVEGWEIVPLFI